MKASSRMTLVTTSEAVLAPLSDEAAAQSMWQFDSDHKARVVTGIREHRAEILSQLMSGVTPGDALAPYAKPAGPTKMLRRAA